MHSNLYLSVEAFSITEHIRKLAMFFSSKGLPLYVGCLESFVLLFLLFRLLVFAIRSKTFKTWASTKYFPHRNTGACTAQVGYAWTIKPALSEILQTYCTDTNSSQGAFAAC